MRVKIFLFIQLAPWSARRHHYTVTSSITHTWLICSHVLGLSQSVHDVLFLSACLLPEVSDISGNVSECLIIQPHQPGWSRVMHMGQKCYASWESNSSLHGQRWFLHVVFLTEKKERREKERFVIRKSITLNILTATNSVTWLVSFKSQKLARPLLHVSLGWRGFNCLRQTKHSVTTAASGKQCCH